MTDYTISWWWLVVNLMVVQVSNSKGNGTNTENGTTSNPGWVNTYLQSRLVGGASYGRLEVVLNGTRGTVCDHGFGIVEASVWCTSLGYGTSGVAFSDPSHPGSGPILFNDVACDASGKCLLYHGTENCDHSQDVHIACFTENVRLIGGKTRKVGRVEVLHNGTWGTVCRYGFGSREAAVVCFELGLSLSGNVVPYGAASGEGPIWLDNVSCQGTEENITACTHSGWGNVSRCKHSDDVRINCSYETDSEFVVRLVDGKSHRDGRVEVLYKGLWGAVCHDGFSNREANVICSFLGFGPPGVAYRGEGSDQIWLDNVTCTGNETSIAECVHADWGDHKCSANGVVHIVCIGESEPPSVPSSTLGSVPNTTVGSRPSTTGDSESIAITGAVLGSIIMLLVIPLALRAYWRRKNQKAKIAEVHRMAVVTLNGANADTELPQMVFDNATEESVYAVIEDVRLDPTNPEYLDTAPPGSEEKLATSGHIGPRMASSGGTEPQMVDYSTAESEYDIIKDTMADHIEPEYLRPLPPVPEERTRGVTNAHEYIPSDERRLGENDGTCVPSKGSYYNTAVLDSTEAGYLTPVPLVPTYRAQDNAGTCVAPCTGMDDDTESETSDDFITVHL